MKIKSAIFLLCWLFALPLYSQSFDKLSIEMLDSLTKSLTDEGAYPKAILYGQEALKRTEKTVGKEDTAYAQRLNNLGIIYYEMGEYPTTKTLWAEAIRIWQNKLGTKNLKYAYGINNMAELLRILGEFEEAENYFTELKNIYAEISGIESSAYASALNNLANLFTHTGRLDQVESLYLQAKEIAAKNKDKDPTQYALSVNNLAIYYWRVKKYTDSEQLYLEALALKAKVSGKEHPDYAMTLNNLAGLYMHIKAYEKAEKIYLEALAIREKTLGKAHPQYGQSVNNLGSLYLETNRFKASEKMYLEALAIWKKALGQQHPRVAFNMNSLAELYKKTKESEKELQILMRAIAANAGLDNLSDKIDKAWVEKLKNCDFGSYFELEYSLNLLRGYLQQNIQKTTASLLQIQELENFTLWVLERTRNEYNSESDKLRLLAQSSQWAQWGVETALQLEQTTKDKRYATHAFEFAEQVRAALLAGSIQTEKAKKFGNLPDALVAQETTLEKEISQQKAILLQSKSDSLKKIAKQKILDLAIEMDAFKKTLEQDYPQYSKLKYTTNTANVSQIQSKLSQKALLITYLQTDSLVYLFCLSRDAFVIHSLPVYKETVQKNVASLRKALSDYDFIRDNPEEAYTLFTTTGYWFYKELLAPALKGRQEIDELIIIPDGELAHIPFETFLMEAVETKKGYEELPYILNRYKTSYNYSASLWKENLEQPSKTTNGKLLAIAASYRNQSDSLHTRANRAAHLRNLRDALQDLPAARSEVESLQQMFKGSFLYASAASEQNFKNKAADYGIIHLAMHGLLNTQHPILSSLAFSEDGDSTEDNFLQAYEISHLKLNAQLVVLSACETGYGKFQQGEGVMSLARSFMYAGVPSLVVSLWQVNDQSTSMVMQLFYENLAKGLDKAAALQQAKLDYIGRVEGDGGDAINGAAHPAFWAPFVQLGDSRPIAVETRLIASLPQWGWWMGAGVLVVGVLAFALRRKRAQ